VLSLRWQQGPHWAALRVDFATLAHELSHSLDDGGSATLALG
jgi:hypothetical protein